MLTLHRPHIQVRVHKRRKPGNLQNESGNQSKVHVPSNLRNKTKMEIPQFPSKMKDREKQDLIQSWRTVYQSMAMSKCTGQQPLSWSPIFHHLETYELCATMFSWQF